MSSLLQMHIVVLALGLAWPGHSFAGQAPETWVISGQANASGWAPGSGMTPHPNVTMFDDGMWIEAHEPLKVLGGTGVGPWLTAAVACAQAKCPIRLTGAAFPGQTIAHWDVGKPGWTALSERIRASGMGAEVFIWYQGESDASARTSADVYQQKLTDLVSRVRALANPQLLVVVIQLAQWVPMGWDMGAEIREAQRQFVINDGNAILVTALGSTCDGSHLTREGYFKLGTGVGSALLRHRYRRKDQSWPGPVMDVVRPGPDEASLVAHFAEVKKLVGADASEFRAIDADGAVGCKSITLQNTRAALTFVRALKPPIQLQFGLGSTSKPGLVDEAGHPAPAVRLAVVAGPLPEDKESVCPNGAGLRATKPPMSDPSASGAKP